MTVLNIVAQSWCVSVYEAMESMSRGKQSQHLCILGWPHTRGFQADLHFLSKNPLSCGVIQIIYLFPIETERRQTQIVHIFTTLDRAASDVIPVIANERESKRHSPDVACFYR